MKKSKLVKVLASKLVIASMVFSSVGMAFADTGTTPKDITGHWAEAQISTWVDNGLIKGYENGSFKPNNSITRAEFTTLVNRSFGYTEQAEISFSDVKSSNWAYAEIAKGVKAGYITGYPDGTIGANKSISRQEVAVIVDRLLNLAEAATPATFKDVSKIGAWAKVSVDNAVAAGILNGYAVDNTFKPVNPITRAETVVTLDRAQLSNIPKVVTYDIAGTYGPVAGTEVVNNDVVINTTGVILQNMTLNGKLLFGAGIATGDVTLKNVTVKGETTVQGGGVDSIHLENSNLATLVIDKAPAAGVVRITAEGTTVVSLVNVNSPVILQEINATGAGFGNVTLSDKLPAGSEVTLKGSFDTVVIVGDGIKVILAEGSIKELTASETSTGSTLDLAAGTTITTLHLNAVTKVTGKGTITTAILSAAVQATGLQTFETAPGTITIIGTATPTPTPGTGGSGSGGSGGSGGGDNGGGSVEVSKTALSTSITVAESVYKNAVVGTNPSEYSQSVVDVVYTAIQTAKVVYNNSSATQSTVNSAVATLDAAVISFQDAVNPNNTDLLKEISVAQNVYDKAVIGTLPDQYSQASKDTLKAAIAAAKTVADNKTSTQPQLNTAKAALIAAVSAFEAVVNPNNAKLITKISVAQSVYDKAVIGSEVGKYSQADKDTLEIAISAAKVISNNTTSTQPQLNTAENNLQLAITTFVKVNLTKQITVSENVYTSVSASVYLAEQDKADFKTKITAAGVLNGDVNAAQVDVENTIQILQSETSLNSAAVLINTALTNPSFNANTLLGYIKNSDFNHYGQFTPSDASNLKSALRAASNNGSKVLTVDEITKVLEDYQQPNPA